jgi:hypothetical protein
MTYRRIRKVRYGQVLLAGQSICYAEWAAGNGSHLFEGGRVAASCHHGLGRGNFNPRATHKTAISTRWHIPGNGNVPGNRVRRSIASK